MTIQFILNKFESIKQRSEYQWQAKCPCHDDKTASLSIQETEKEILFHCHAGCRNEEIAKALNIEMHDLFKKNWNKEKHTGGNGSVTLDWLRLNSIALYPYRCKDNNIIGIKRRYNKNGEVIKGQWLHPIDNNNYKYGYGEQKPELYRLPELLQSIKQGEEYIFDVEGEKDVDTLKKLNLTATTSGSTSSWKDEYKKYYKGAKTVIILPDNDQAGKEYANKKAMSLFGIVKAIKIINLPGLSEKEDITDWINNGHTKEELLELEKNTKPFFLEGKNTKPLPPENFSITEEIIKRKAKRKTKAETLTETEEFLKSQYKFRFNIITYKPEYSLVDSDNWTPVEDGFESSCYFKLIRAGINFSKDDIHALFINPDFSEHVDPLKEYFDKLIWDKKKDYIKEYTDCFTLPDETKNKRIIFEIMFKKWFVAILTGIYNDRFCNQCIFIIIGEQGEGKTTFLNALIPPVLKDYHQNGGLDFLSKDSQLAMVGKLLINIDELESFTKQDVDLLKSRITATDFDIRPPYKKHSIKLKKRCSFMASTNKIGILNDYTGSRRFFINMISNVDYKREINIEQMYAQAKELYFSGYQYYLNSEEILCITKRNEEFSQESIEEQLLLKFFTPGEEQLLSTTELAGELERKSSMRLQINNAFVKKLGGFLTKHKFQRRGKQGRYVWCVSERRYQEDDEDSLPSPL